MTGQRGCMTKTHALSKLLEHGHLTLDEMTEITGWKRHHVYVTVKKLCEIGVIGLTNITGQRTLTYALELQSNAVGHTNSTGLLQTRHSTPTLNSCHIWD